MAPERAVRGQLVDITYTVTNTGPSGVPDSQGQWTDLIYLSRDKILDLRADRFVSAVPHSGGLAAGASYTNPVTLQLPPDLLGPWHIIVVADPVRTGIDRDGVRGRLRAEQRPRPAQSRS